MKILHTVESYLPSRHGMSEVVRQLSEWLAAQGHEVTVATRTDPDRVEKNINGVNVIEFDISGSITGGIQGEYDRYIQFLLDSNFDIVTNFAAQQWATDLALPIISRIRAKKVFVPTGFSALYLPQYQSYFARMKTWLGEYDQVVYLSDDYRDVNFARGLGLTNGTLITNGASAEEFQIEKDPEFRKRLGIPENDLLLLHIAGYVGGKGHLDAIHIFNQASLKNSSLLFVSPDFGEKFDHYKLLAKPQIKTFFKSILRRVQISEYTQLKLIKTLQAIGFFSNIHFIELHRKEVIQAYLNSDLLLFPSHVECSPIVLFESMAAKTPFLVTDVGNAKEIIEWSGAGMILPSIPSKDGSGLHQAEIIESSVLLQKIANDSELRRKMAESGYKSWKERFTWESISLQYETLYSNLISQIAK